LVFIVDYSLLKFFQGEVQRELSPSAIVHMKSTDGTMPNLTNEQIWEKASLELEGKRREGLWARCFAQSNGDENRARALYLRNRVSEIESELNIKPTSKNFAINIPLLNEAKEWWDTLNFVGKICVIGLIIALLAHYFGWIDG
jgi:hypothetical protein